MVALIALTRRECERARRPGPSTTESEIPRQMPSRVFVKPLRRKGHTLAKPLSLLLPDSNRNARLPLRNPLKRGEERGLSEPGRLGQIDPEAVTPPLVLAGHLRRGVAKLLLHIALINLGRGSEAGAQ